jgi:hypothetical protein
MLMIMLPLVALAIQQNSMCAAMITCIIFGSCDLDLDPNTALSRTSGDGKSLIKASCKPRWQRLW